MDKNCIDDCEIWTNEGCGINETCVLKELSEDNAIAHTYCRQNEPTNCHNGNDIECSGNGKCAVLPGDQLKSCFCKISHAGQFCEQVRTCENGQNWKYQEPCLNGGHCENSKELEDRYTCKCPLGYFGDYCEKIHRWNSFTV